MCLRPFTPSFLWPSKVGFYDQFDLYSLERATCMHLLAIFSVFSSASNSLGLPKAPHGHHAASFIICFIISYLSIILVRRAQHFFLNVQ